MRFLFCAGALLIVSGLAVYMTYDRDADQAIVDLAAGEAASAARALESSR